MSEGLFEESSAPRLPLVLRPYQDQMVNAYRAFVDKGGRRGMFVAATGAGKTAIANAIIRVEAEDDPGKAFLFLAHRKELLEQAKATAKWVNPDLNCTIHCGEEKGERGSSIIAGSVQSLGGTSSTALDWFHPDMVIADECHHSSATTYQNVFRRFGCYDDEDPTLLIGFTATPHRMDNKALVGGKAIFEEIIFRYDLVAAIKDGFLVDLKGYRAAAKVDLSKVQVSRGDYKQDQLEQVMNVDPVNQLAYESWVNAGNGHQTIVFCSGVDHAKAVAEVFREKGVTAAAVYGDMPKRERQIVIDDFREGRIKVLTNMDILTEGFDAREAGCVILLRPTKSWSLFVQMIGRGLRTLRGVIDGLEFGEASVRREAIGGSRKPECVVIDIVGIGGGESGHNAAEKKDGSGTPSLNELVGLPEGLDLEGQSVIEALEQFEDLPDLIKGGAFKRKVLKFSDLTSQLSLVEMLTEIEPPEEAVQNGELYWLKTGLFEYSLDCGSQGGVTRHATLAMDDLGEWHCTIESTFREPKTFNLGTDLPMAFRTAEGVVTKEFMGGSGIARLASRKAEWRTAPPTDAQLRYLVEMGIDNALLDHLTRGTASAMITILKRRKLRSDRENPQNPLADMGYGEEAE